jgi:hypothetical protein
MSCNASRARSACSRPAWVSSDSSVLPCTHVRRYHPYQRVRSCEEEGGQEGRSARRDPERVPAATPRHCQRRRPCPCPAAAALCRRLLHHAPPLCGSWRL